MHIIDDLHQFAHSLGGSQAEQNTKLDIIIDLISSSGASASVSVSNPTPGESDSSSGVLNQSAIDSGLTATLTGANTGQISVLQSAGMNVFTGRILTGIDHLKQSIRDILLTPIGTRVMRRDYGSRLFELIDQPLNNATILAVYAEVARVLEKWEPRFNLKRVSVDRNTKQNEGNLILNLQGVAA